MSGVNYCTVNKIVSNWKDHMNSLLYGSVFFPPFV